MANTPYCSLSDFTDLFDLRTLGELSNDTDAQTTLWPRIQSLLNMAGSELDTTLSGRVPLPPTAPDGSLPPFLKKIVADLTIDYLYGRRADKPKQVQANADAARDWMKMFRENVVQIPMVPSWAPVAIPPCGSDPYGLPGPTTIVVLPPAGTFME